MKVKLKAQFELGKPAIRTKPVDYFKRCPQCGEQELICLDPDVLCSSCDWDSLAWDVSRGAMDDLALAADEFFKPHEHSGPNEILEYSSEDFEKFDDLLIEEKEGA
jgi:hypothetical protein